MSVWLCNDSRPRDAGERGFFRGPGELGIGGGHCQHVFVDECWSRLSNRTMLRN